MSKADKSQTNENKNKLNEEQRGMGDDAVEAFMINNVCLNLPTLENIKKCIKSIIDSHKMASEKNFAEKLRKALEDVKFEYETFVEDDGSYTFSLKDMDIAVNGRSRNEALNLLIADVIEYCHDYCDDLDYWYSDVDRRSHVKYVLKVLLYDDNELKKDFICQSGQN